MTSQKNSASFRDPNGFIFSRDNTLYRQINQSYAADYDYLMSSGLYEKLVKAGLLITHSEANVPALAPENAYQVIQPDPIAFISYPYEWSFGMLKAAALTTLNIQKRALKHGMSLKDASAYNIQFVNSKAVLIDTLSFEQYEEGKPWVAYRQFCQHFLAPLVLMARRDIRLGQLLKVYIDGIPLDLTSGLLPLSTRLNGGLLMHIHLHANAQQRYAGNPATPKQVRAQMSKNALIGLIESLEKTVRGLKWQPTGTEWGNYYEITNYTDAAFEQKKNIIAGWLTRTSPRQVWDLGANDGSFSRLASQQGIPTLAFDIDPAAVEKNYQRILADKEQNLTPLLLDLTNPSPAIGWHNRERSTIFERGSAEMVFALALIHHLTISNNVPLTMLADFFAQAGKWLVIEFVPKSDSQVQKLLQSRQDIFPNYTEKGFETSFSGHFEVVGKIKMQETERYLYLMKRR
jgi:ribosomal protein L11 methylase PrmA